MARLGDVEVKLSVLVVEIHVQDTRGLMRVISLSYP